MIVAHSDYLVNIPEFTNRSTTHVLHVLVSHCHGSKNHCYVSQKRIAAITKYCEKTVCRAITLLKKTHFITVIPRYNQKTGKRTSNLYIIKHLGTNFFGGTKGHSLSDKEFSESIEHMEQSTPKKDECIVGAEEKPYDFKRSQSQKPKAETPKPVAKCKKPVTPQPVAKSEEPIAPKPVTKSEEPVTPQPVAKSEEPIAPKSVAKSEEPVTPQPVTKSEEPIAPKRVANLRFSGPLTNDKIIHIYKLYCSCKFIQYSTATLLEFLSTCEATIRLNKAKKCGNIYAYLTWIYKNRKTWAVITDADESKARGKLRELREKGLIHL